jgi:hypothetical protein
LFIAIQIKSRGAIPIRKGQLVEGDPGKSAKQVFCPIQISPKGIESSDWTRYARLNKAEKRVSMVAPDVEEQPGLGDGRNMGQIVKRIRVSGYGLNAGA